MEHPEKIPEKAPRAHRFTRRARLMMILAAALVLAGALVLLLPAIRQKFPSQFANSMQVNLTYKTLATGDVNVLDTITVRHKDGETYTLRYRDQNLYLEGESGSTEIVNESYTDEIVTAATQIDVEDTVVANAADVSDHLADMGLEPPEITVEVRYANGESTEILLGALVPGTMYHYYRWSGDAGVYMCDVGTYEAFEYTAHMLLPVEQPTFVPALIDHVTLQTSAGGLMEMTFAADGSDAYLGALKKPYAYPMDSEQTASLLNAFKNFRMGTRMEAVTAENRASYGFDKPTAVLDAHQQQGLYTKIDADGVLQTYQTDEQTIRLRFGAKDGEYFYFCEYAGVCYRVSSFLVTAFLDASPDLFLTRAPADLGSASIASIAVQLGDGMVDVRATYTEHMQENNQIETDSQGKTVYDLNVTANGEPLANDAFEALVTRLKQMTVSGRLETQEPPTGTPRWQMTLTTTGGATRKLAAYPLDAFNDVLVVDGVAMHYLNAEAIQIALADLYPTAR